MKKQACFALAAMFISAPLAAQKDDFETKTPNKRVITSMGTSYLPSKCAAKDGKNFMVSSVITYYSGAFKMTEVDLKAKAFRNANRVAKEAIVDQKQDKNGSAWYWLGRVYLIQGDVPGADTAFTRAEALYPDCVEEIKAFRLQAYNAIIQPAAQLQSAGKADSAEMLYREANMMSRTGPAAYFGLAILFVNKTPPQNDSAIYYFKIAQEKANADPARYAKEREQVTYNIAGLLQDKGDDAGAVAEIRKLISWNPTDPENKRLLRQFLASSKDPAHQAEAKAITAELLKTAEAEGTISAGDLARIGIDHYNSGDYVKAAEYFGKGVAKEPWRRDILFNQINAYFANKEYARMIPLTEAALKDEPLSAPFLGLLFNANRAGQVTKADSMKTVDAVTRRFSLITSLEFESMAPMADGAELKGDATGQEGFDANSKPLAPAEIVLVFEFTDNKGAVVSTTEYTVPALKPDAKAPVVVKGTGKGIVGWRYHLKPKA